MANKAELERQNDLLVKALQLILFPPRLVPWESVKPRYSYKAVEPQMYEITDEQTGATAYVTDELLAKRIVNELLDKGNYGNSRA
jgi:hypothetical protein